MIEHFVLNKNTFLAPLFTFLTDKFDFDFYFTENNARIYVQDEKTLRRFLKQSRFVYVSNDERGDPNGLIMLWKSVGGGKERFYLKIKCDDTVVARNLLTILLWNVQSDVYAKIRKDNSVLSVLRNKGFRFLGGRGLQVLLVKKFKPEDRLPRRENDKDEND